MSLPATDITGLLNVCFEVFSTDHAKDRYLDPDDSIHDVTFESTTISQESDNGYAMRCIVAKGDYITKIGYRGIGHPEDPGFTSCTCKAFQFPKDNIKDCKHIIKLAQQSHAKLLHMKPAPEPKVDQLQLLRAANHTTNVGGKEYVLYSGLIWLAHKTGLASIDTEMLVCDFDKDVFIFRATASGDNGTFTGIGDATPKNCKGMVATCKPRMAETRAKARALKDYLSVAMCALDEREK
mgnify:FL=1